MESNVCKAVQACLLHSLGSGTVQRSASLWRIRSSNTSHWDNWSLAELDQAPTCAAVYCPVIIRLITNCITASHVHGPTIRVYTHSGATSIRNTVADD